MERTRRAFTLIELLIVVAIIAILAAVAVPNFLVAQTRAKVSRTYADMRTVKGALESYHVDYARYPETDFGAPVEANGAGLHRLTTPVFYATSIPQSVFMELNIGGAARHANTLNTLLYVRARYTPGFPSMETDTNQNEVSDSYEVDRVLYLLGTSSTSTPEQKAIAGTGDYMLKSVGPNSRDDRSGQAGFSGNLARLYDPTNGINSEGDMITFRDRSVVMNED